MGDVIIAALAIGLLGAVAAGLYMIVQHIREHFDGGMTGYNDPAMGVLESFLTLFVLGIVGFFAYGAYLIGTGQIQ